MDPLTAMAAAELKRRLWRLALRVAAVAMPLVVVGGLALMVFATSLVAAGSDDEAQASVGCTVVDRPVETSVGDLDAEQLANAQTIVAVGRGLGVPEKGWVVALATALQESTLRNLPYGDRDSIGLFQQRDAWGSRAARLDPATATTMFFTGGHGGQRGLLSVPDYLALSVAQAAQAVQVSAFPNAYARWEALARQLAGSPSISSAVCTSATTGGMSKIVDVALSQLGVPYAWGGGTLVGPGPGFGSGAGVVGFDCSGLVRYVVFQATGITLPRVATDQAAAVARIPPLQAKGRRSAVLPPPRRPERLLLPRGHLRRPRTHDPRASAGQDGRSHPDRPQRRAPMGRRRDGRPHRCVGVTCLEDRRTAKHATRSVG